MTAYAENAVEVLNRVVGNLEPIGFQLLDINRDPLDVTGKTLKFRMVNVATGTAKITAGTCTITTAATGIGQYQPTGTDFDTAGTYAAYIVDDATVDRLFPYDGAKWLIRVVAETEQ